MALIRTSSGPNPLRGFQVDPALIHTVGQDLQRPECILAERDGTLWSADARGGVMRIAADGTQLLIAQAPDPHFNMSASAADSLLSGTLPNGLAFADDGDILISNFGTNRLERMTRSGQSRVLLDSVDGRPLGKVNFVLRDSCNRIWLTVSTMVNPWSVNRRGIGALAHFWCTHAETRQAEVFCLIRPTREDFWGAERRSRIAESSGRHTQK